MHTAGLSKNSWHLYFRIPHHTHLVFLKGVGPPMVFAKALAALHPFDNGCIFQKRLKVYDDKSGRMQVQRIQTINTRPAVSGY
jgi:hypothetical protein